VTAVGKLFRTTAFKLSLAYLTVFVIFAAFLLGYFAWNTQRLVTAQITQIVDAETAGLADQYRAGGLRRLLLIVDARSRRPGSSLYIVTDSSGDGLAGNVTVRSGTLSQPGLTETFYRRLEAADDSEHRALVRVVHLASGYRLMVGRDLEERERVRQIVVQAGKWSIAVVLVLGLAGGFFVARRMLKRVDAMTETAHTIMAGNLSGRLPVSGTGDELDRLATNLNSMLERIEALMIGLKEVSDNIAHDLKTPLTRLRNRSEAALRSAKTDADYRAALESTIEESDELIRTFNALLMIARVESGHAREGQSTFDAADVVRDVGELYEPLAEEKGLLLKIESDARLPVLGNRELMSQALSNLIDNAIKYSGSREAQVNGAPAEILVAAKSRGDGIVLSVSDAGPGIADPDKTRAVERFVRLESSRTQPGSGLGLSLVSAVARLHGGELTLKDNNPGLRAEIAIPRGGVHDTAEHDGRHAQAKT
jgi:signal transduction histidine kinase